MEKQLESEKKSKNLLNLLKELFEIIDVKRCGFVSFEEVNFYLRFLKKNIYV